MYDSLLYGQEPIPTLPANEPVRAYAPGSPERAAIDAELRTMASNPVEIPLVIGGKEVRTGRIKEIRAPHDRSLVLGRYHEAGEAEAIAAADAAAIAYRQWSETPFQERAAVFRKAADLISSSWWKTLNASTMLGQSKNVYQAEIDATCETADFYRINPALAERLYAEQPRSGPGERNILDYRPLDGFVYAVTPFNFTAIAANLPSAPALMGNTVVWKPASTSVLSNWHLFRLCQAAGLPDGVINFLPGSARAISKGVLSRPDFAGLHFTGSTAVFNSLWKSIADNLSTYRAYPRLVGETGGKDFIFVHPDADTDAALAACVRGAFEYQGQKCSAASRLYAPRSTFGRFLEKLATEISSLRVGSPTDHGNFVNAVIDEAAFDTIVGYIERARANPSCRIVAGGTYDKTEGFYIAPTLIVSDDPRSEPMAQEIFGPVLTAFAYDDSDMAAAYELVDSTSPYALTGAVFARDRLAIVEATGAFRYAAGNFYINDKPSGAVVGRQPFGGTRGSGTNDKAGSIFNLFRWTSPRTIKENFAPATDWRYPFLG
ncbi:MAG: 1-pyrroline-5-carboxylate dehydrogenase [Spirochaetes bacterium GWB1_59_5]|nr:MAG: 1-pyrroline-5-carboxylate dehydrogenase [Spirochaetes bacterium GWB1_59_5]